MNKLKIFAWLLEVKLDNEHDYKLESSRSLFGIEYFHKDMIRAGWEKFSDIDVYFGKARLIYRRRKDYTPILSQTTIEYKTEYECQRAYLSLSSNLVLEGNRCTSYKKVGNKITTTIYKHV